MIYMSYFPTADFFKAKSMAYRQLAEVISKMIDHVRKCDGKVYNAHFLRTLNAPGVVNVREHERNVNKVSININTFAIDNPIELRRHGSECKRDTSVRVYIVCNNKGRIDAERTINEDFCLNYWRAWCDEKAGDYEKAYDNYAEARKLFEHVEAEYKRLRSISVSLYYEAREFVQTSHITD